MKFSNWLVVELKKREWTNSDLAKKAGLSRQAIGYYVGGRVPDNEALTKIAKALDLPVDVVYRAAGILSQKNERDELTEQAAYLFNQIERQDVKQVALQILKNLASLNKR